MPEPDGIDATGHDQPCWLLRDGDVLAALVVAGTFLQRWQGLLGRSEFEGAMLFPRTRAVHTLGMRFPIDVAFVDRHLRVVDTVRMVPWRIGRPRRCSSVLEAQAGAFERWNLRPGDELELRPCTSR